MQPMALKDLSLDIAEINADDYADVELPPMVRDGKHPLTGKAQGRLGPRGWTREERIANILRKFEGTDLPDLIRETLPLDEVEPGLWQTACPMCRSAGCSLLVTGTHWTCISPPCQAGRIYMGPPFKGKWPIEQLDGPVGGGKLEWLAIKKRFAAKFKQVPDLKEHLRMIAEAGDAKRVEDLRHLVGWTTTGETQEAKAKNRDGTTDDAPAQPQETEHPQATEQDGQEQHGQEQDGMPDAAEE